jgi:hypothetical protein
MPTEDASCARATGRSISARPRGDPDRGEVAADSRDQLRHLRENRSRAPERLRKEALASARRPPNAVDCARRAGLSRCSRARCMTMLCDPMAQTGSERRAFSSRESPQRAWTRTGLTADTGLPTPAAAGVPHNDLDRLLDYLAPKHAVKDTVLLDALQKLKDRTNALGPSLSERRSLTSFSRPASHPSPLQPDRVSFADALQEGSW